MSSWHTSTDRSTGTSLGICATMLLWLGACSTGMATERLGHVGVDRPGGDLPNMPVSMPSFQAAPEDCAKLCLANTACSAWVFESAGTCRSSPLVVQDSGQPAAAKCWLKATLTSQRAHPCRVSGVRTVQLQPLAFRPLPLGSISASGWLRDQLKVQASGLSGHLALFWPDINESIWIGGTHDPQLHERVPYWLNGIVPLAYHLRDSGLVAQVHRFLDYIIAHQEADGWLGPDPEKLNGNDYWSRFPLLMSMIQYHEANATDKRVIPAIVKFLQAAHTRMLNVSLSYWASARWQDLVWTCHYLLDNELIDQSQLAWDVAELAKEQGLDWEAFFGGSGFPTGPMEHPTLAGHGVNVGQALKSGAVWFRQSNNVSYINSTYTRIARLDKYHGAATGLFGADGHLAGRMPSRGVELCTVVESMFSYETIFSILGNPNHAERAEKIAYNALPATFTKDMWAHQYIQQPNEANAIKSVDHIWTITGPNPTLYGLAPNFGCCTANFNQGWPKLTSNLVMQASSGALVIGIWAPCKVAVTLGNLTVETNYPFGDTANVTMQQDSPNSSVAILLRIPSWSKQTSVIVNGHVAKTPTAGTLYEINCTGLVTVINVRFDAELRTEQRFNNATALFRGALLYSLSVAENFTVLQKYEFDSKDYQVTPISPWNYALYLPENVQLSDVLHFVQDPMPSSAVSPYDETHVPVYIKAKGQYMADWSLAHNAAAAPPPSPISSNSTHLLDDLILKPYGATCLRMAEMPTVTLE